MAFTLVSCFLNSKKSLPYGIVRLIRDFNDERHVNRCKFITSCLNNSDKFKKVSECVNNSTCLFGINNINGIDNYMVKIFKRNYIKEIFNKINPVNSYMNKTLKQLKQSNNANDIYQKKKYDYQIIILKKSKRVIRKSVKYYSIDNKIKMINKTLTTKILNIYNTLLLNIDKLWLY